MLPPQDFDPDSLELGVGVPIEDIVRQNTFGRVDGWLVSTTAKPVSGWVSTTAKPVSKWVSTTPEPVPEWVSTSPKPVPRPTLETVHREIENAIQPFKVGKLSEITFF